MSINKTVVDSTGIKNGSVTPEKLADKSVTTSSSCGNYSISATAAGTDTTNLSVTITRTGRPVMLMLVSDGSGNSSFGSVLTPGTISYPFTSSGYIYLLLLKASTEIARTSLGASVTLNDNTQSEILSRFPVAFQHLDTSSETGSKTYKIQAYKSASGVTASLTYYKLIAFEL